MRRSKGYAPTSDIDDTIPCPACGYYPFEHPNDSCHHLDRVSVLRELEKMEYEEEEQHNG